MLVMRAAATMRARRALPAPLRYTTSFFPNGPAINRGLLDGLRLNTNRGAQRHATTSVTSGESLGPHVTPPFTIITSHPITYDACHDPSSPHSLRLISHLVLTRLGGRSAFFSSDTATSFPNKPHAMPSPSLVENLVEASHRVNGNANSTVAVIGSAQMVRWAHSLRKRFDKVIVIGGWGGWENYWRVGSSEVGSKDSVGVGDVEEDGEEEWTGEVVWLKEGEASKQLDEYNTKWLEHTTAFFGKPPESWTPKEWQATQVVNAVCQSADLMSKGWTDVDVWRELSSEKGEVWEVFIGEAKELQDGLPVSKGLKILTN